jgi:hypothetical protein
VPAKETVSHRWTGTECSLKRDPVRWIGVAVHFGIGP